MARFRPTEVRASELARGCERQSVMRALGTYAEPPDAEQKEWFERGHLFEEYVVKQLIKKYGEDDVERQVDVHHPLGVGHVDAAIRSEKALVEIKSTQAGTLSTPVFDNGVRQLRFYLRYHDWAEVGWLCMINPSTLKPAEVHPVHLTPEHVQEIDAMVERVTGAIITKALPDRVCRKPSDARGMFCPFATECFIGWEPPPVDVIDDPDAIAAAAAVCLSAAGERELRKQAAELEATRREAQAVLAGYVRENTTANVGEYTVKRWEVRGKRGFSLKAAEAAAVDPEILEQFITFGEGHTRFEVTLSDRPSPDVPDFGDEAPF